ncbi:MAG: Rpn family recombination-promoting nuclease/putative transposase [Chitinispirillales bacterium]|nr:Rpn family recombination-promoting nuclease/putative transposase [Chitinispirillales bacterium]
MPRYLDPKNDLMFKTVFGEHKNLCISLLNSLLKFEGDRRIESVVIIVFFLLGYFVCG